MLFFSLLLLHCLQLTQSRQISTLDIHTRLLWLAIIMMDSSTLWNMHSLKMRVEIQAITSFTKQTHKFASLPNFLRMSTESKKYPPYARQPTGCPTRPIISKQNTTHSTAQGKWMDSLCSFWFWAQRDMTKPIETKNISTNLFGDVKSPKLKFLCLTRDDCRSWTQPKISSIRARWALSLTRIFLSLSGWKEITTKRKKRTNFFKISS